MQLEDWLDDLCVRFIVNLPPEELASVERICFQVEEAQWFYEDFIRPLDPGLPSLSLRAFSLRIFQHCPLFSQWSAQHHTTAFAEFLAYKQRVPVRGAIMLNESMDDVVLVKGWKKGANWSFPRGKINKGEDDLDCAVREVYEETGLDLLSAGLVKSEREMKYIEVTMREQHMRLYVFRGVPKDTHFEPRTRKEISKIEWYKLTDLPTLKKKQHQQEGKADHLAINANKFYMVAPFLNPLKKWIAQQKKREGRYSSHLAAAPVMAEEVGTEDESGQMMGHVPSMPLILSPQVPSTLPEVNPIQLDAAANLKDLLKIGRPPQSLQSPNVDTVKSNALLSLLRSGSTADFHGAQTKPDEVNFHPQPPQPPQKTPQRPPLAVIPQSAPAPSYQFQQAPVEEKLPTQFSYRQIPNMQHVPESFHEPANLHSNQNVAPYQRTGDPHFFQSPERQNGESVPPANALPTLTHHTKSLLDAFKVAPPVTLASSPPKAQLPSAKQDLLAAFMSKPRSAQLQSSLQDSTLSDLKTSFKVEDRDSTAAVELRTGVSSPSGAAAVKPQTGYATSLLDLLKKPTTTVQPIPAAVSEKAKQTSSSNLLDLLRSPAEALAAKSQDNLKTSVLPPAPVELAATPSAMSRPKVAPEKEDLLSALFGSSQPKHTPAQMPRPGQPAAVLSGPIIQPQFDAIHKTPAPVEKLRRSPVAPHRTLFDPKQGGSKQPTPVKILSRPDDGQNSPLQSPRIAKSRLDSKGPRSPRRVPAPNEPAKTFQPQILKRPQTAEAKDKVEATQTPSQYTPTALKLAPIATLSDPKSLKSPSAPQDQSLKSSPTVQRLPSQQPGEHRQSLLSLFQSPIANSFPPATQDTPPIAPPTRQPSMAGTISPLTASYMTSPLLATGFEPGIEPISTRSRVSSLASVSSGIVVSGGGRPTTEKRQTNAGDKAFLLNYLGRIASQEGT